MSIFSLLSKSPTNPQVRGRSDHYDVAELFDGPIALAPTEQVEASLDEKLRQAYFWIVNNAIISPHYDIEYNDGPAPSFQFGNATSMLRLPSGQSYSSFVLLPVLNFAVR